MLQRSFGSVLERECYLAAGREGGSTGQAVQPRCLTEGHHLRSSAGLITRRS